MKKLGIFFISLFLSLAVFSSVYATDEITVLMADGGPKINGPLENAFGWELRRDSFLVVTSSQSPKNISQMVNMISSDVSLRGRVVLVCHSAGCAAGQKFAAVHPEKILVFVMFEPVLGTGKDYQKTMGYMVSYYKKNMRPAIFKDFMTDFAKGSKGDRAALIRAYRAAYKLHGIDLTKEQEKKLIPAEVNVFNKSILSSKKIGKQKNTFPVYLVYGKDGMFPRKSQDVLKNRWRNSHVITISGDHMSILNNFDLSGLLKEVLKK